MNIIKFETIESTNTYVKENINSLADKDVVCADNQTKGRGRFDRVWTDLGAENIYMTICLKPSDEIQPVYSNLTQYLSLCLCKELEKFGLKPQIKWPNDVLISGKKVSGILAETVVKKGKLKGIALGIGINLNASRIDLSQINRPVTSVNLELLENVDKIDFMQNLLETFFENYDEFLKKGFKYIKEDYEKRAVFFNKNVKIAIFDKTVEGKIQGVDDAGAILLLDKTGKIQSINMGEII